MSAAFTTFFDAWGDPDAGSRAAALASVTSDTSTYSDPRSGGDLVGTTAIAEYVAAFSANAPGWSATVENSSEVNGYWRLRVAFGGKGPGGQDMVQHGTYFAMLSGGMIALLAGFVGAEA
ncbi:MAG: nuclear transport factor 2 family protein [Pseudomonadota bacterium]